MVPNSLTRVIATDSALDLLASLREKHGPLLFVLSGSISDGNSPICYALGQFSIGSADIYLGNLEGTPFYVGHEQFEYWKRTQLIIDVVNGTGAADSLDSDTGKHFLTRSRQLSDEENKLLEQTYFDCPHQSAGRG
jgi:hypothetical protein